MCMRQMHGAAPATTSASSGSERKRGDVVHHHGSEPDRPARDLGLRRVDRDRQAVQLFEDRQHAAQLLVDRDTFRARPGRFAADVDKGGAFPQHAPRRGDGVRWT